MKTLKQNKFDVCREYIINFVNNNTLTKCEIYHLIDKTCKEFKIDSNSMVYSLHLG
jgi:hypothetical protein